MMSEVWSACFHASQLLIQYYNVFIIKVTDGNEICVMFKCPCFNQKPTNFFLKFLHVFILMCALSSSPPGISYVLLHPGENKTKHFNVSPKLTTTYAPVLLLPPAPLLNLTTMTVMLSGQPR